MGAGTGSGSGVPRIDGRSKLIGTATYTGDLALAGLLHARLVLSPHASGRVAGRDVAAALAVPGAFGAGQNCSSAFEMGSVTLARSAAVGTRVLLTVGFTWRKPSHEAKKNVLSLITGPPAVAPN